LSYAATTENLAILIWGENGDHQNGSVLWPHPGQQKSLVSSGGTMFPSLQWSHL
jgi:hypothetical protein